MVIRGASDDGNAAGRRSCESVDIAFQSADSREELVDVAKEAGLDVGQCCSFGLHTEPPGHSSAGQPAWPE